MVQGKRGTRVARAEEAPVEEAPVRRSLLDEKAEMIRLGITNEDKPPDVHGIPLPCNTQEQGCGSYGHDFFGEWQR